MTWLATGSWVKAYEVDFAAQATQDIKAGGDGPYTIDGKQWTASGSALASTLSLTNGVGLEFVSSTTGSIEMRMLMSEVPGFTTSRPWRLMLRYSNYQPNQDFENVLMLVSSAIAGSRSLGALRGWNAADRYFNYLGTTTLQTDIPAAHIADNLYVVETDGGTVRSYAGVAAGAVGVLPVSTGGLVGIAQSVVTGNLESAQVPFEDLTTVLRLGLNNSVAGNAYTVEAMRVDIGA